jgi:hypothetical protein
MAAKTFSYGYKLLCRFFKQIGFYYEFLEYQRNTKYRTIPFDSSNIIDDFGCSSITFWFIHEKNINFKVSLYFAFQKWLFVFYQEEYGASIVFTNNYFNDDRLCVIDKDKKTIKLEYTKC